MQIFVLSKILSEVFCRQGQSADLSSVRECLKSGYFSVNLLSCAQLTRFRERHPPRLSWRASETMVAVEAISTITKAVVVILGSER